MRLKDKISAYDGYEITNQIKGTNELYLHSLYFTNLEKICLDVIVNS